MLYKNKSPLVRGGAERASKENSQNNFTKLLRDSPLLLRISVRTKKILVHLGANGLMPHRLCTWLINFLGLRGV